jgi:adenylate cyclase
MNKQTIEKLEKTISNTEDDCEMLEALIQLGNLLTFSDPGRSFELATKAISTALYCENKEGLAESHLMLARAVRKLGDNNKALEHYQIALEQFETLNNRTGVGESLCGIGVIYGNLNEQQKALEYYQRALDISQQMDDWLMTATNIGNIGNFHFTGGNFKLALEYYRKSLSIYESLENEDGITRMVGNIGGVMVLLGEYSEGESFLQQALARNEAEENRHGIATSLLNLGDAYLRMREYNAALDYLYKALKVSEKITAKLLQFEIHKTFSEIYDILGNGQKAYHHFKQFYAIEKEVRSAEARKQAANLEIKKQLDIKAREAELEKEKRTIVEAKNQQILKEKHRVYKEKENAEELLLNILPFEIAMELKEKGHSEAKLLDQVTVLFTDFKGFTKIAEELQPKELVENIHECFKAFDEITEKYGIEKIKTMGDSYMAAGGLPVPNETHAIDVVCAAFEIQRVMDRINKAKIAAGKKPFEIRIGIHTGPVVAGIVGIKKFSYDIWGDTVNTASRMESSGVEGKINISGQTHEFVKDQFKCIHRGKVAAKNKGDVDMYFVVD